MSKSISIFGSTGSIGQNTVSIIKNNPEQFSVLALVAKSNFSLLAKQVRQLRPKYVVIANEDKYQELKSLLSDLKGIEILAGFEAILDIAKIKCDLVISAIVGSIGMKPTLTAIRAGSNIALANKESLVCGGDFLIKEAQKSGSKIIPIDSEHNAIFQIFEKDNLQNISNIILTASGGPFFSGNHDLSKVTIADAVNHPNWSMGAKVSIDSATMMNKGLELIEAYYLFPIEIDQLKAVVHPQSIIHGMVNYKDGSTLAMMSYPDMKVPISYALSYPKRMSTEVEKLDFIAMKKLEFFAIDEKIFPAVNLCLESLKKGGNMPIVLNAANEIAVNGFLENKLAFNKIVDFIKTMLDKVEFLKLSSADDIIDYDFLIKRKAQDLLLTKIS